MNPQSGLPQGMGGNPRTQRALFMRSEVCLQTCKPRMPPATLKRGHPNNRHPRFRFAVYATDRAAHPRTERLLRGAALHRAASPRFRRSSRSASSSPAGRRRSTMRTRPPPTPSCSNWACRCWASATACTSSCITWAARCAPAPKREYGHAEVTIEDSASPLFAGLPPTLAVWMSHGDEALELPAGFHRTAVTANALAGIRKRRAPHLGRAVSSRGASHAARPAAHQEFRLQHLRRGGDWTPAHFIETTVAAIREKVGSGPRHLRPLRRRGFVGGGGAGPPGHRQPAHLHLRQQRRPAQKRIRQRAEESARQAGPEDRRRGRQRALPRATGRRHRPGNEAKDHRRGVHRRLRRRGHAHRQGNRRSGLAGAGHALPRRDRVQQRERPQPDHQEPPQRGRPAAGHEAQADRAAARSLQGRSPAHRPRPANAGRDSGPPAVSRPRPRRAHPGRGHAGARGAAAGGRRDRRRRDQGRRALLTRSGRALPCCCR